MARARLQFKCVLTDNPPSPEEVDYTTGLYIGLLFSKSGVNSFRFYVRRDLRFFVLISCQITHQLRYLAELQYIGYIYIYIYIYFKL